MATTNGGLETAMQSEIKPNSMDFSSLTLDTAIQLDRLEKHKTADLNVINDFAKFLAAPSGSVGAQSLFCLQENPISVDIFTSAISGVEGAHLANLSDLEAKVRDLIARVSEVASGSNRDEGQIAGLKRFCLSLHRVLLDELSPSIDNDEWMPARDERFA
jgi:hypothetical protein